MSCKEDKCKKSCCLQYLLPFFHGFSSKIVETKTIRVTYIKWVYNGSIKRVIIALLAAVTILIKTRKFLNFPQ